MKTLFFILTLLTCLQASAEIRVAFIEMTDPRGRRVELEPGGRFAHVAVSTETGWLHAYPPGPVRIANEGELKAMGKITIITLDRPALTLRESHKFIGKAYDNTYSWSDDKIYSSELVGKLLNIEPLAMDFSGDYWRGRRPAPEQEKGLSPDDIYRSLSRQPSALPKPKRAGTPK